MSLSTPPSSDIIDYVEGGKYIASRNMVINSMIRFPEVRVIDSDGKQLGVLATNQAIAIAQEKGLDLILISVDAKPPVCRITDYGKIKYEQSKKDKQSRKGNKGGQLKEMKMTPKIGGHDFEFKTTRTREFLEKGCKVKVTIHFRGREATHPKIGENLLLKMIELTSDIGIVESPPKFEGRNMLMILAPK